eukprot:gene7464-605_t
MSELQEVKDAAERCQHELACTEDKLSKALELGAQAEQRGTALESSAQVLQADLAQANASVDAMRGLLTAAQEDLASKDDACLGLQEKLKAIEEELSAQQMRLEAEQILKESAIHDLQDLLNGKELEIVKLSKDHIETMQKLQGRHDTALKEQSLKEDGIRQAITSEASQKLCKQLKEQDVQIQRMAKMLQEEKMGRMSEASDKAKLEEELLLLQSRYSDSEAKHLVKDADLDSKATAFQCELLSMKQLLDDSRESSSADAMNAKQLVQELRSKCVEAVTDLRTKADAAELYMEQLESQRKACGKLEEVERTL